MQNFSRFNLAITVAFLSVSLAGCGGGGGGGTPSTQQGVTTPAAAATPTLAITVDNAPQVAAQAFSGTAAFSQAAGAASITSLKATDARMTRQHSVLGYLSNFSAQHAQSLLGEKSNSVMPFAAKAVNESATCAQGGSYTLTGNVSDSGQPAVGNTLTASFNNCNDGTETVNGALSLTLTGLNKSTNGTGGSANMTMHADNLSVASANSNLTVDGSLSVAVQIVASNNVTQSTQVSLTSPQLTFIDSTYGSQSVLGLNYTLFNDLSARTWWFTQDDTVNDNGQVFAVKTTQKFAGMGCAYPASGSAIITGSKSSVVVTAMANNQTQLQIDTNGDNTIDTTKTVSSNSVFALVCP